VATDDDDLALIAADVRVDRFAQGRPGSATATSVANAEGDVRRGGSRPRQRCDRQLASVLPRHGMTGFLAVPMYFGVELVKVTPMDFLRDTLLWAKLIDKYNGTMTAAPNFAYNLLAKRCAGRPPRRVRPVFTAVGAVGRRTGEPIDVADSARRAPIRLRPEAICLPTAWPRRPWRCRSPKCGSGLEVDEVDADLLGVCAGPCRRPWATPAGWSHSRPLARGSRPASSTMDGPCCLRAASVSSRCAVTR
jgi:hypothetical protein